MDAVPNNTTTKQFSLPPLSSPKEIIGHQRLRIVFGRQRLAVDELEALKSGEVVSLQEAASEAVEVLHDGRVIARVIPVQQAGELAWQVTEVITQTSEEVIP